MVYFSLFLTTTLAVATNAHTIFQVRNFPTHPSNSHPTTNPSPVHANKKKVSINSLNSTSLAALRAPSSNNPVLDVTSSSLICGTPGSTSSTILPATPGDKIGAWWQHVIGGPQGPNDADNPIAASHKGPVMAYMARVDNAATTPQTGLEWFKISEDGFDTTTKKWGVGAY